MLLHECAEVLHAVSDYGMLPFVQVGMCDDVAEIGDPCLSIPFSELESLDPRRKPCRSEPASVRMRVDVRMYVYVIAAMHWQLLLLPHKCNFMFRTHPFDSIVHGMLSLKVTE